MSWRSALRELNRRLTWRIRRRLEWRPSCWSCRFGERGNYFEEVICVRHAPERDKEGRTFNGYDDLHPRDIWPSLKRRHWCGDWKFNWQWRKEI